MSSVSQTPSLSVMLTSRTVASEDSTPSTAPTWTWVAGVESVRETRLASTSCWFSPFPPAIP
ncbi:hypothetical protein PMN64_32875 [Bradyrhizobium sp. UFLA01-814]|uniref:hypothetical protein n=1 Tax=Bradyrhizobium sp. UFLA01-814 TaxID=3023480 RepID=UPI00398B535A